MGDFLQVPIFLVAHCKKINTDVNEVDKDSRSVRSGT